MKIEEVKKGIWVEYDDGFKKEIGRIKSWNKEGAFVVYERPGRDMGLYEHYTPVLTKYEDLKVIEVDMQGR